MAKSQSVFIVGLRIALLCALACFPASLRAAILVSSLSNSPITMIGGGLGTWIGSSFTTDTQAHVLDSVVVDLQSGFTVNVKLYSDTAGRPGVALADLGTQTLTNGGSLWTFKPTAGVTLNPSTTYWVAAGPGSTTNGVGFGLLQDQQATFTYSGIAGASMAYSTAGGVGSGTNPPAQFSSFATNYALAFQVTIVSPATLRIIANANGTKTILSEGGSSYPHLIQAATNLVPPTFWQTLGSNVFLTNGVWTLTDTASPNFPIRFYRSSTP